MKNIGIYICLVLIILFGIILFDYAFPELSIQRGCAAILSIYCFSFAISTWLEYEKNKNNTKDN